MTTEKLPEISVTEVKMAAHHNGNQSPIVRSHTASFKIHIIASREGFVEHHRSTQNKRSLIQNVLDALKKEFIIQTGYPTRRKSLTSSPTDTLTSKNLFQSTISKGDVVIYLFTDSTIDDRNCFHDLCSAIALKIPILFIKDQKCEIPAKFTSSFRKHSQGCVSFSDYIERYIIESKSSYDVGEKRKPVRQKQRLAPLSVPRHPSSGSELNVRGIDIRKRKQTILNEDNTDSDLLLDLAHHFQCAFVFDDTNKVESKQMLIQVIHKLIHASKDRDDDYYTSSNSINGISSLSNSFINNGSFSQDMSQSPYCLRVPDADLIIATREWGVATSKPDKSSESPKDNSGRFSYDIRLASPLPLEEKETTYLIFQDKSSTNGIRKINFPVDGDKLQGDTKDLEYEDEFDPSHSPIHIPDIDLGREINESLDTPDTEMESENC